jgi:hypothetical protein
MDAHHAVWVCTVGCRDFPVQNELPMPLPRADLADTGATAPAEYGGDEVRRSLNLSTYFQGRFAPCLNSTS